MIRPVHTLLLASAALFGCRAHRYGASTKLSGQGRCEDALGELTPERSSYKDPGLKLVIAAGVARGQPTGVMNDDADYTPLSLAMRGVAACYESRGDEPSLVTAFVQLQQIVEGPVYDQSTTGERQRVDAQLTRVEDKLKVVTVDYGKDIVAKDKVIGAPLAH